MGLSSLEIKNNFVEHKFFNMRSQEWEAPVAMGGRKKVWDWMVLCLRGPAPEKPLFCAQPIVFDL